MLSRPKRGANGAGPSAGAGAGSGAGVNGGGASSSGRSGRPRTANSKPGRSAGMGSGAGSVGMVVYDDTGREDPLTRAMAPPPNETCVPSLLLSSVLWPAFDLCFLCSSPLGL